MKNACCCPLCKVAGILAVLGAINWGLVGALNMNLVSQLLGVGTTGEKFVYILIGIAGILKLLSCFLNCPGNKNCGPKAA